MHAQVLNRFNKMASTEKHARPCDGFKRAVEDGVHITHYKTTRNCKPNKGLLLILTTNSINYMQLFAR